MFNILLSFALITASIYLPVEHPANTVALAKAVEPDPIAVVTQIDGDVRLQRKSHQPEKLNSTAFLYAEDVLNTRGDGTAVIYQVYAPVVRLAPNQNKLIKRLSPPPRPGTVTPEDFAQFKKTYSKALKDQGNPSPRRMGGPDEVLFAVITPRYSTVLEDRPVFEWTPANDAKKYKVTLYDDNGNPIWETETAETKVKYPDDRPKIKPGKYQWEVIAQVGDGSSKGATFTMTGEKERRTISDSLEHAQRLISDENTINIIYIGALLESKLYLRAEKELKRTLTHTPNDQGLWALLMETYQKMRRWEDREKARLLKANLNDLSALKQFLSN